uniref:F-box domain-containing protein n=1 Tax=Caenorhabditis tropicalis TaxID=1561998 RepID=A0A1I7U5G5_9PELO
MNLEKELSDLKISSSEIPPNLCDLPVEIVQMIVKNLDLPRRVIIGRVCKTLRELVGRMEPLRVNDIKITVGSEGCEMKIEGYPIKYKTSEGGTLEESLNKMFDDLLHFVPDFQLNTISFRYNHIPSYKLFRSVFSKRVSQPLTIHNLFIKSFRILELCIAGPDYLNRKLLSVLEYHSMEQLDDDIIKVKVCRIKPIEIGKKAFTSEITSKYFREGQEDVYVDEPELLPPREQSSLYAR